MTQPFYIEYKTFSALTPAELDRQVNQLLGKEVRKPGNSGVFRWTMHGPLSTTCCISTGGTRHVFYSQAMGLAYYRELTEVEWQADLMKAQQKSFLEQELDSPTQDPILSFINS